MKKGEVYPGIKKENGFYQIELSDGTIGWVRDWHAKIPLKGIIVVN